MVTFSPVECYEVHGTRSESMSMENGPGYTGSVVLRTPWSKRAQLVDDLLLSPRVWPYATGALKPYAVRAGVIPEPACYSTDGDGQIINYEWAQVSVEYELTFENYDGQQQPGDRQLLAESLEPMIEFNTIPAADEEYFFDPTDTDQYIELTRVPILYESIIDKEFNIGYPTFTMRLTRTLYNRSSVPQTALNHVGKINAAQYQSNLLGLTFGAEQLLFEPPSCARTISMAGTSGWNITAKFHFRNQSWNKFWNPKAAAFEYIHRNQVKLLDPVPTVKPFETADFSDWLF